MEVTPEVWSSAPSRSSMPVAGMSLVRHGWIKVHRLACFVLI